jgi:GT2 family glycosyltransferase
VTAVSHAVPERVGVVVVTYQSAATVQRALDCLCRQTRLPDRVVVFDNASSDATVSLVSELARSGPVEVEVVRNATNLGFAAANNRAVDRLADCNLIALVNPDVFAEPDWLAALLRAAVAHPEAASFASRLMLEDEPGCLDGAGDVYHVSGLHWRHGHGRSLETVPEALTSHEVFSACAAAALYRRADWARQGGFDERFFCYSEDVDLGFRLQRSGRRCWYVADAVARHLGSASSGVRSAFAVYHGHRNLEWTYFKNMPRRLAWRYAPLHALAVIAGLAAATLRGRLRPYLRAKRDAMRRFREFAASAPARDEADGAAFVPRLDHRSLVAHGLRRVWTLLRRRDRAPTA